MLATEIDFIWLRPWWLLALIPAAFLSWRLWQTKAKQGAWHKIIDPQFQPLLLGSNLQPHFTLSHKVSLLALSGLWMTLIFILAGPSFKAVEIPAQKSQKGSVIVLDLSLSMLADDLAPNRLNHVKFKLTDLIKANPQESIGIVAYAGTAHTITPISEDNQTLLGLLPSLNPLIMPEYGSDPLAGLNQAKQLFAGAHITDGHILWITDDIEAEQTAAVIDFVQSNAYSLSILTVGTQAGGLIHIPNYGVLKDNHDQVVLAAVPTQRFVELSQQLDTPLKALKIEDADLDSLLNKQPSAATDKQKLLNQETKAVQYPLDQGVGLLLLLVPLIALIYRRGWVFSFVLIGVLPLSSLSYSPQTLASTNNSQWDELANMFQTHDQQAFKAWNKNNYAAAEALFENPQWQASALYRLGRYAEAAKLYARDKTPNGLFNFGNALAKSGDLQGAKQAYQKALKLAPEFTAAKENLALIEKLLEQQAEPPEQNEPQAPNSETDANSGNEVNSEQASENQAENAGAEASSEQAPNRESKAQPYDADKGQQSESSSNANSSTANNANRLHDSLTDAIGEKLNPTQKTPTETEGSEADNTDNTETSEPSAQNPATKAETGEDPAEQNEANSQSSANNANATDSANSDENAQLAQRNLLQETDSEAQDSENTSPAGTQPNQLGDLANRSEKQPSSSELSELEQQIATDNWIQQIPDNPSLFLKRKFEYQYNQRQANQPANSEPAGKTW